MSWLRIDDRFPRHPKVQPLSDAAFRLHMCALCYCSELETDGRVSRISLATLTSHRNKRQAIDELVKAGLWVALGDDGWEIYNYLKWNLSHEQLEQKRADKSRAGKAGGSASWRSRSEAAASAVGSKVVEPKREHLGGDGRGEDLVSGSPDPENSEVTGIRAREAPDGDTGYSIARRVFAEEWQTRKGKPYAWSPRTGKGSDDAAMLDIGRHARERGGDRAEAFMRHWAKAYVRDTKQTISDEGHPARFLTRDVANKYGEPAAPKSMTKLRTAQQAEPVTPALSVAEQGNRAAEAMKAMGKIGMGGRQ